MAAMPYNRAMKTKRPHIAVIGGGASGLAAAIAAADNGARVDLIEERDRVGKSILVTGDGRCNVANSGTAPACYRNPDFVARAFQQVSPEDSLGWLQNCGLMMREEAQGRLYPYTGKATTVVDVLRAAAAERQVHEACHRYVRHVDSDSEGAAALTLPAGTKRFDAAIIAVGGVLPPEFLPQDVDCHEPMPVLGPLACSNRELRALDKLRAKVALTCNDVREEGEVTFRRDGVSGIVAFDMSRIAQPGDTVFVDFLPEYSESQVIELLRNRMDAYAPAHWEDLLRGMLLPRIAEAVLKRAGLNARGGIDSIEFPRLAVALDTYPLQVDGIADIKRCQVHRGGVSVDGVDPATMQVSGHPSLFACGEALDVDAPCGGYNLHWAWTSGLIAGTAAAKALA